MYWKTRRDEGDDALAARAGSERLSRMLLLVGWWCLRIDGGEQKLLMCECGGGGKMECGWVRGAGWAGIGGEWAGA